MAEVVTNGERPVVAYAQPLSRLQVSWGSILAGAITALSIALILWLLAMSIVWTAMEPTAGSVRGSLIAAWITGMVCIIAGAFAGGMVAGYLPGNPRRLIAVTHGFLAWGTAFLVATMTQLAAIGAIARTAAGAVVTTATTAVQATGEAIGGAAGGAGGLQQQAMRLLTSLGYSPAEAQRMIASVQADLQGVLRGEALPSPGQAAEQARSTLDSFFAGAALYTWLWFGAWVLAAGASVLGASMVIKKVRLVPDRELAREELEHRHPPLRPTPQAAR
jgi:hypothetical protein